MMYRAPNICGLLGNPVKHSLSPVMQNSAFKDKGLDYTYFAFNVEKGHLKYALEGARALNFRGLNITIPYKVSVIELLDELDPVSLRIGAVNTVVNTGGTLKGYNTDAGGFIKALQNRSINPAGKNIVILGGGGASRAVAFALAETNASITLLNRLARLNEVSQLAQKLSSITHGNVQALALNPDNLSQSLKTADIVVNATSVGMHPKTGETLVPAHLLHPGLIVFDLVYNPLKTRLLSEAEQSGAESINGLEMLIWQGALAFELWTGLSAPAGIMRSKAIEAISSTAVARMPVARKPEKSSVKTSIALTGFMGSGKTTVAKIIAEKTGKRLLELDRIIEINAGATIPEIFSSKGEVGFREMEIETIKEISTGKHQVISCGGGVVLNKINIDRLRQTAVIVYLNVKPEAIMQRMQSQDVQKPILKNPQDPEEVQKLLTFREPYYKNSADIIIDSTDLSPQDTAKEALKRLANYEGFH